MKKKYRIKKCVYSHESNPHLVQVVNVVQVRNMFWIWNNVKEFSDQYDEDFAKREAVELYENLLED